MEESTMRLRAIAVAALSGLALLAGGPAALAGSHDGASSVSPDSLRGRAAEVGLRIGTAIIPFDLDHPDYRQIAAAQFSTVTPGNEMKWQAGEPHQGVLDWLG